MRIEKIKSVLLVSLFVVSLIFTQRLWFYFPFGGVMSIANDMDLEYIDMDITDILSPQNFVISFGGGYYTVFFSEPYEVWNITNPVPNGTNNSYDKKDVWIWETAKNVLEDYLKSDYNVQEITLEEWEKVKKFKSLKLNFACGIPGDILIDSISNEDSDTSKIADTITTILIPATDGKRNNIYFGNNENNIYLKLNGGFMDNRVRQLIDNIENIGEDKGYLNYVTLNRIAGVNNNVLTPLFDETSKLIPSYNVKNEIDISDKSGVKSHAYQFFNSSFDFVKEINEIDGTVIYMYGYGEKTLKISKNGVLEYREKIDNEKASSELDFIDSLKYAVKFVEEKGKWPINRENAYLSGYKPIEKNNTKGYRFSFNYRLKGLPVFIPDIAEDKGIEVEVIGRQITNYRKIVKSPPQNLNKEENSILSVFDKEDKNMLKVRDVLRKNSTIIKNNYIRENKLKDEETKGFKSIDELIEGIGLVYYSYQDKLIPVWEITIDDIVYYFDLYTGDLYTGTRYTF